MTYGKKHDTMKAVHRQIEKLNKLIEENLVRHWYQPIVSLRTGAVFAYEALMRSLDPNFASPADIIESARRQNKLYYIEKLTWFNALKGYAERQEEFGGRYLFVNSIPNQMLTDADRALLEQTYAPLLDRLVVEFTEEERVNAENLFLKKQIVRGWGARIALDDFGTGYSDDNMMYILKPHFVKMDMYLIQGADKNPAKRRLLNGFVRYCHERKIRVICEGVETSGELEAVVLAGADFVQGYYLCRPAQLPQDVPPARREEIKNLQRTVICG